MSVIDAEAVVAVGMEDDGAADGIGNEEAHNPGMF